MEVSFELRKDTIVYLLQPVLYTVHCSNMVFMLLADHGHSCIHHMVQTVATGLDDGCNLKPTCRDGERVKVEDGLASLSMDRGDNKQTSPLKSECVSER